MMFRLSAISTLFLASAAQAQYTAPVYQPPLAQPVWSPASQYVTAGQDEPGYRNWYIASARHAAQVTYFNRYLDQWQVSGVVPTWQLLRTASQWRRCGAQPFEVPPLSEWPNVVQTLRYIRDYIVPAVGPVEPVSAYRNPYLNACAGGAPESSHKNFQAIDLVPLQPITRERLMRTVCSAHLRQGEPYQVGLGFYAFVRFHIDTSRFRKWGMANASDASPCSVDIPQPAPVPPPQIPVAVVPAITSPVPVVVAPLPSQPAPSTTTSPYTPPPTQPTTIQSQPSGPPAPQPSAPQPDSAVGQVDPLAPR